MTSPASALHATSRAQASRAYMDSDVQPRASRIRFTVRVSGSGETRLAGKKALQFDTLLLEEPTFSFGIIAVNDIGGGYMPQCTAIVLKWHKSKQGLWTSADLGFVVDSQQRNIVVRFSLTFEATALRTTAGVDSTLGGSVPTSNGPKS